MPCRVALAIGESFAEVTGFYGTNLNQESPPAGAHAYAARPHMARWYLSKKTLQDGLKEAFKAILDGATQDSATNAREGELFVSSESVERILNRRQGRPPAVLVTAGFETFIGLAQPFVSPAFAVAAQRRQLPIESDIIFGINERTTGDGKISKPLNLIDLESVAAKLESLKVKDVALVFFHADKNATNEIAAEQFFKEKGLRVHCSHRRQTHGFPLEFSDLFHATLETAFSEAAVQEEREQIDSALKALELNWEVKFWSEDGLRPWSEFSAARIRGGRTQSLNQALGNQQDAILHCGFDGLQILKPQSVKSSAPTSTSSLTRLVEHGLWPFPHIGENSCGYEPGPMLFGKSQQLSALDVLYVRDRLKPIEGFSLLINEKTRPRILDNLFTLAKAPTSGAKKRLPDAKEISAQIEHALVSSIAAWALGQTMTTATQSDRWLLTGPFAATLAPLLQEYFPQWKIKVGAGESTDEYFESHACFPEAVANKIKRGEA